jgi:hypothetical protein
VLLSIALPVAVVAWTASGPLRPGWAKRAGTPTALIASSSTPAARTPAAQAPTPAAQAPTPAAPAPSAAALTVPFSARFDGTQRQSGPDRSGLVSVNISGNLHRGQSGVLTIVLTGQPAAGGGVELTGSQVTLGPASAPGEYQGHVTQLSGNILVADLTSPGRTPITATIDLQVTEGQSSVTGTVQVRA